MKSRKQNIAGLVFGACFGALLAAANLHEYDTIHAMLRFDEFDVYGLMASAIALAGILLWWFERRETVTALDGKLTLRRSRPQRHHLIGGALFGVGWAIAGTCPGPALVMVSSGATLGFVALLGIFIGIYFRDRQTPHGEFGDGEHHSPTKSSLSF
jgi:hypothetical protein